MIFLSRIIRNLSWFSFIYLADLSSTNILESYYNKININEPVLPKRPFISVWNIETGECDSQYGVKINLKQFDIVSNSKQNRDGNIAVIFYANLLGNYPYFDNNKKAINGGLPQLGNLTSHLHKCIFDIKHYIPDPDFAGISVIDWEPWTPLWSNMGWGKRKFYQDTSIKNVKKRYPDLNDKQVLKKARTEYEAAAKSYIVETLKICKKMRPKANWGFYLYPDCYNYNKSSIHLECPPQQILRDDEIQWMFDTSTALYPSTYLGYWFKNSNRTEYYTAHRVSEAKRVNFNRPGNVSIPIYVYNNLVYRKTKTFLTLEDLIDSSGISAVLGASGVVLWGDHMHTSKEQCVKLSKYVNSTLGPFMKLASDAASDCSLESCNGNGRCALTNNKKNSIGISRKMKTFLFVVLKTKHINFVFYCQCYIGFYGDYCQYPEHNTLSN